MALVLILFPVAMAALALAAPSNPSRLWLLPLRGVVHLILTLAVVFGPAVSGLQHWLLLDALGKVFLGFLSILFFLCALYAPGYLAERPDRPNRVFCANLFVAQAMMTLVTLSHHLGLLWVAMEAITLSFAPLLYFDRSARSLQATWKHLVISSVGLALALLGSFFVAYSAVYAGQDSTLLFDDLIEQAPLLSSTWLRAAFVLLLVRYGTKMGLAPMHTW